VKNYIPLIFSFFFFIGSQLFAQNENNVWYFGDGAGLDFNSGIDPTALENASSEYDSFEGCSSVSNLDGELLFYCDGERAFRSDHQVMTNGYGLNGNSSTIQSTIIVPSPADDGTYYLFTLDTDYLLGSATYTGLSYSIIDMNLWFGFGAVTEDKNIQISDLALNEGLTAVMHANGTDVWVLVQQMESDIFEAYLITADGISTTPVLSTASIINPIGFQSCLKVSPNGYKVASIYSGAYKGEVLDFDPYTGILSNAIDLEMDYDNVQEWSPYGCEFSPSGDRLYVSHLDYGPIVQYDMTASDIPASRTDVGINNGVSGNPPYSSLQLAPNGKIYAACFYENFISVINSPDELAADVDFVEEAINFETKTCSFGLPQFVQASHIVDGFTFNDACRGDTVFFTPLSVYDSLYWDFGDINSGDDNYSTDTSAFHVYNEAGIYTITLESYLGEETLTSTEDINVPGPTLELGLGDSTCLDYVEIDATIEGAVSYLWYDDSTNPIKWVQPPGIYWVTVDEGLCTSTDTIQYWSGDCAYMLFPNIITPNGDGHNDTFLPLQAWYVLSYEIQIFDRWGKQVYASDQYIIGWDGKDEKGKEVADGVYFYMIRYSGKFSEEKTINSTLQVTRVRNR